MQKLCPLKLSLTGGWGDDRLQNELIFSAVHEISCTFEILTPKTHPPPGGVGGGNFLLVFWAAHDISRTFEVLIP